MTAVMFMYITARLTSAVCSIRRSLAVEIARERRQITQICTTNWMRIVMAVADCIIPEMG